MIKNQNKLTNQQQHSNFVKHHSLQKSLQLSKKERLEKEVPPNKYLEQKYLLEINPYTGRTHPEEIYKVQQELKSKKQFQHRTPGDAIDNQWVERGPNNVGGRTRVVLFDPNDATHKRVFAGGVSGGLWVNNDITDANSSWTRVGIDENLSVTCMAVDPNNSQIMYLGTGELYSPQQALGNGIWKSTDGGATWTNIYKLRGTTVSGNVPGTYFMTDIIVRDKDGDSNTTNDSEVFAAIGASFYSSNPINTFVGTSDYGIFKSTDDGENWLKITLDVEGTTVAPNKFEIGTDNTLWLGTNRNVYGKGGGLIYNSSDGITFTLKHTITNGRRTEIAASKINANTVYVLAQVHTENVSEELIAPFVSLLKTTDAFATSPSILSLPNDADTGIPADDFTRGQAFYDLVIEVDPTNDAIAYVGGIDLFRTTDSGANWTQISKWSNNNDLAALTVSSVHADQHGWMFHPTDANKAIIGNDGGVFYANSLSTAATSTSAIEVRNKDYNITQFYNGAFGQNSTTEYILGGSQDNGTQFFNNATSGINSTISVFGGDGTQCFIDKDGAYMIVTYLYNRILRFNLPYTNSYKIIQSDKNSGDFVNAMALDDNLDILYSNGSTHLARYTDITTDSPVRTNITDALLNDITALKVSPFTTTSSKVYAGTRTGKLVKIENAETETQTITDISGASFLGSISSIEFGANENEIMVTFYNFGVESIWFTDDGGASWANKEGNLPDINVRCILMNPLNTNEVIIGTELGVWNSSNFKDPSPTWNHSYNGMSNVAVTSFDLRTVDNTVLASSYGRGMYTGKFEDNKLTIWTGTIDSDWTNTNNWTNGLPAINVDVKIPDTTTKPILNTSVTLDNLSVETDAALTLNTSAALTIKEDLTINGTLTINSTLSNSGSLIVEGNSTGNLTYNRYVSSDWHLVSSPLYGQNYDNNWVSSNSIASGTVNPNQRGIATYSNDSGSWNYMLAGETAQFNQGTSYSMLRTETGNLSFTGTLVTENVSKSIDKGSNNAFNLLGNVFTSYIPLNPNANSTNNFLTTNSAVLDEFTIWLWNGTSYTPTNLVSTSQFAAPGQGFFVKSKPEGGQVSFTEQMQSHQNKNFLKSSNSRTEIKVIANMGDVKKHSDIFYIDNATTGFDNGFDSTLYSGLSSNFEVFTKLANGNDELKLSIQSIPQDYSIVIPVGIIAPAHQEIKISIDANNIYKEKDVYLEDKKTGKFILMNSVETVYKFTSATLDNESERFFIHTKSKTLAVNDSFLSSLHIFTSDTKLQFVNLPSGKKSVKIYNLLGKLILEDTLESKDFISTKNLPKAIYIISIETEKETINKKALLE
ncbi:T9SS type A sorting domain-containing protein [Polaribacter septentrionalilitoris]|uniref:T9SS type A sorting domain-containing protein n=1 Tax=Polaribacter septentrionalilitoris TaxID=2494657 RepID=UPI0013581F0D|nr:T9SS type A sorting domain-containing protein [Polaribacter septentrionalilitoris]